MKKIKFGRILLLIVLLFIIIKIISLFFCSTYKIKYKINTDDKEYLINENYTKDDYYYLTINYNSTNYFYKTGFKFKNKKKIIKEIYSITTDNYKCILPVYSDQKFLTDILCINNNTLYFYNSIKGKDINIDNFAHSMKNHGYNSSNWSDNSDVINISNLKVSEDNLLENNYIALSNYKGLYLISHNNKSIVKNIELFNSDVYKQSISAIINKTYIVADYNQTYRFNKFYTIDLITGKKDSINCNDEISFDSYIQGIYDNSIYIFDKDSKKQYQINMKTKKVIEVGNENSKIKIYKNGEWIKINVYEASNSKILFQTESIIQDVNYSKIVEMNGWYYFYKKIGNKYLVYRSTKENREQLTYLFDTTDIERIVYSNNKVYFIDNDSIKNYSDEFGIKTVIQQNELNYNNAIIFGAYQK